MRDLWSTQDLPVLRAYAELEAEGEDLLNASDDVAANLGLTGDQFDATLRRLENGRYVQAGATFGGSYVEAITERGLREAGVWPSEQTALERMIAALDAIGENASDDDTRTKAQKFASWLRASGTTVGLSVASSVITGQVPGN